MPRRLLLERDVEVAEGRRAVGDLHHLFGQGLGFRRLGVLHRDFVRRELDDVEVDVRAIPVGRHPCPRVRAAAASGREELVQRRLGFVGLGRRVLDDLYELHGFPLDFVNYRVSSRAFFSSDASASWNDAENEATPSRSKVAVTSSKSMPASASPAIVARASSRSSSTVSARRFAWPATSASTDAWASVLTVS